ncbi:NAD-dependent epimerase/dehydratase family protein [Saccharospirillum impatiens]|uniref:NAD-dependent epimerase/dehydratase family protein n=1 Tax=Saccharospirillum impatiens TaxID=169438 RepID=UPI0003FF610B|nr:NAD-dependent epimerase/dehydratase family protein [Saccharospirillum impatiens]
MKGIALILGITGGVGNATARALANHGWQLRALHRNPEQAKLTLKGHWPTIDWQQGDATHSDAVSQAAVGCNLIVHGVNPPGYRNWRGLALPMLTASIAAAKTSGATLLFPGNVYNFGPDAWPDVTETSAQNPVSRKGKIRVEMEQMLKDAAKHGCQSIILRAGDFFGPNAGSSWFENVLVKPGRRVRSVTYPGQHQAGHAWAYLPDLAETFARLAERRRELDAFASFNLGGHYLAPGVGMAEAIRDAAGEPAATIRGFPWWSLRLIGPFNETFRELAEMRYLWENTLRLNNHKLAAFLGEEPHTPIRQALTMTLTNLGCIQELKPRATPA